MPPDQTRPSTDRATAYAKAIVTGEIVAGKRVRQACQRHLDDLERGHLRGLKWSPRHAAYVERFYSFLRHSKGKWAAKPFVLADWQAFCEGSIYGWLRADGSRRFRTALQVIAKKNGKSLTGAAAGLFGLVGDGEMGGEVYCVARKRDQARIIFDEARQMVRSSPDLSKRVQSFKLNLSIDRTASKFEPLSSDEKTGDGLNPSLVLVDELHRHKSRALLDLMDAGMGSRRQPLLRIITTAGDDDPESPYNTEVAYAEKVLDGVIDDDSYFAYIARLDEIDRWDDPKVWLKANPNLGVSVALDDLKRQAVKARGNPSQQSAFKRYRLNLVTSSATRAIDMEVWRRNGLGPIDPASLTGRPAYGAIDASSKLDLSAFVLLFPPVGDGERWKALCRFWMPAENVEAKQDKDRAPYRQWIDEGWIEATPGNVIDHGEIEAAVLEAKSAYELLSVPYDPWNAAQMATRLMAEGVPMVEFIQGLRSYTAPTKELLAMLAAETLDHGDNPVLRLMAANLKIETDKNENMMPHKKRSTGRIDGMTALIMDIGRALLDGDDSQSGYETERLLVV